MEKRILVIDDDRKLNHLLKQYLSRFGYKVYTATSPDDGFTSIKRDLPQLIILDIMLPDMDGFEVCKRIRKDYDIPIIMLTARGEVTDRIVGLEIGADDYLPKPFEARELVARIQSIFRRSKEFSEKVLRFYNLVISIDRLSAYVDGNDIGLTNTEFETLSLFVKNPNTVLTRDQILDHLRGMDWDMFNRSVDVLISRLRNKLGDNPKSPSFIKTMWGAGYMFIAKKIE